MDFYCYFLIIYIISLLKTVTLSYLELECCIISISSIKYISNTECFYSIQKFFKILKQILLF